jgi:hypothetical protein
MGRVHRPLRTPQSRPRRLRPFLRHPLHPRACLRCPLLRPDPAQHLRLAQICDNLTARIAEAEAARWIGEAEGLKVSLAGARDKLTQMNHITASRSAAISLGIPGFASAASRTVTTQPATSHDHF